MNEGSAKQQIVEAIKTNTNILVTVSDSPSVDELSAALGLTLLLNKIDKRATSIFSGSIPPAITFLDPQKTFEGSVDSLRDFIIALDKEKADHLRYKVDGDVVKIFITPYRTTLSQKDLEFSQGDYNVEMVLALGVKDQNHLDKALSAHGRILHDATVATISVGADPSKMGSIDWRDAAASSLCEMLVSLSEALKYDRSLLDDQVASAFLTGIVSATDRFSNDHTSSRVMTMAAQLMAAGANQQLIAAKLQEAHDIGPNAADKSKDKNGNGNNGDSNNQSRQGANQQKKNKKPKRDDNSLTINREEKQQDNSPVANNQPLPVVEPDFANNEEVSVDAEIAHSPVQEEAAVQAAVAQAEPVVDVEQKLAEQLAEVAVPVEPVSSPADLEKELNESLEGQAMPAPVSEPDLAVPSTSDGMPGFETLDVPAPVTPEAPQPAVSGAIESRPGNTYISPDGPSPFDAAVNTVNGASKEDNSQYIDPFATPLAPMPDLRESKEIPAPTITDEQPIYEAATVENIAVEEQPAPLVTTLDQLEKAVAMPPLPPTDMPPLPPLPDFSGSNLPPLPPPPPPPVFDQPMTANDSQSNSTVPGDQLGDIFGNGPAPAPDTPQAPPTPPKPGQFQIPGM